MARARGRGQAPTTNHLISRRRFRDFLADHPSAEDDAEALFRWCKITELGDWRDFRNVKSTFGTADLVGRLTVFNVGGNKYRVIVSIKFKRDKPAWVYVKHVLTHKEYDKGDWKAAR